MNITIEPYEGDYPRTCNVQDCDENVCGKRVTVRIRLGMHILGYSCKEHEDSFGEIQNALAPIFGTPAK